MIVPKDFSGSERYWELRVEEAFPHLAPVEELPLPVKAERIAYLILRDSIE